MRAFSLQESYIFPIKKKVLHIYVQISLFLELKATIYANMFFIIIS